MCINKLGFKRLTVLLSIFILFILCSQSLYSQSYGLKFKGFDHALDQRTELNLTPDGFLKFKDEFELTFDYKANRLFPNSFNGFFGYIFRIVDEENNNIDLLSMASPGIGLGLVIGKSHDIVSVEYPLEAIDDWINLRVKFFLAEDRIEFYTPDTLYSRENIGFKKQQSYKIIFGANDYGRFKNSDVPSMSIKNINISEKGKLKYQWLLNEKEGDIAIENLKGKEAEVINPSWLIVSHQNWEEVFQEEIIGNITIANDEINGRIFLIGAEDITIYSSQNNTARKIKYKNKPLFFNRNYRSIYNSLEDKIYCYVVDEKPFYSLDINTGEWNDVGKLDNFQSRFRHNNQYYRELDNSIYLLGGYGFHTYNNELVKIDLTNGTRTELQIEKSAFHPRYLAGSYCLNDTIYLLGGYGSESGNQAINPQSYFDLVAYSINDSTFERKFEIPRLMDDMVVANSMWIDELSRNYYALVFSKIKSDGDLQLIKGSLDNSDVRMVGNKIPFVFHDIRTTANLYFKPTQNKLYTCTSYFNDSTTKISIYTIDNPPNETLEVTHLKADDSGKLKLFVGLLFVALLGFFFFFTIRKKKKKVVVRANDKQEDSVVNDTEDYPGILLEQQKKYHVIMFGGFQVFNREQEDITNKFSPLLKELFLLIQLHTFKNNKGISSDKITEVLWYDKSVKSARNNRAVNIAKLRGILEEIGPCELSKKTGYWKIDYKDSKIKSDYFDLLNITASKNNLTKQKVNLLIEITKKGAFLSNVHYDWLDEFKASVSDTIIDTLIDFGQSRDVKAEADFVIHLADSVFNFDMINEDAMRLKCKAQYCMGKHSHAKATYEKFFNEYLSMYGQEYDQAFLDVLEIKE